MLSARRGTAPLILSPGWHYEELTGHYTGDWVGPTVGLHVFAPDTIRSSNRPASAA